MPWWKRALLCAALHQLPEGGAGAELAGGHAADLAHLRPATWSIDANYTACELPVGSNHFTGVCANDLDALQDQIPFCRESVKYRPCIPAHQPLWPSWNASVKDDLLAGLFKTMIEERLPKEMNNTPLVYVPIHLLANAECTRALKNLLCWYNFPKCDDDNRSLPLCRTSCEQYYTSCGYEPNASIGGHNFCTETEIARNGLFQSGSPGSDQLLAEDTSVCESTKEEMEKIQIGTLMKDDWLTSTWYGLTLLGVSAAAFVVCACAMLVPRGIKAYVAWFVRQCVYWPLRVWDSLPLLKGTTLMLLMAVTFLGLFGLGLWKVITEGGLDRFRPPGGNSSAANISWHGNNTTAADIDADVFRPPESTHRVETKQDMPPGQLRQLVGSCSCTGAAGRRAEPLGLGVVLLVVRCGLTWARGGSGF